MHTYRTEEGWSSTTWPEGAVGDITRWHYEEGSGLLLSKEDAAGKAVTYTYEAGGRLATRTWARQKSGGGALRTTYGYHPATGELTRVDYNDTTPDVGYVYDRLGRQKTVTDGTGTRAFGYDAQSLQLHTETLQGPEPAVLTRYYDPTGVKGRPVGLSLGSTYLVGYGYGATGQLQSVSWMAHGSSDVASYSRVPGSELLAGYSTLSGFGTVHTYEPKRDLKTQVRNSFGGSVVSQYDYRYDAIGRRTSVENSGSAFAATRFTSWGYDDGNQVTASNRYTGSFTASPNPANEVTTERRVFDYDPIGNRETALDQDGSTSIAYAASELNQYETVGPQAPTYDEDGNLLGDGTKVLQCNAENQLVRVEVPGVSVSTYLYDYIGRRVRKSVDLVSGDDYVVTWVYSGWNRIAERRTVGSTMTVKNFVWGLDLSQSMEGAGGIGGLLAVVDEGGSASLFAYDGNGNVSELVNASTGSVGAHYEYDAFGNTLVATGTAAADNAYRFSTKYADDETGLVYYGYRYYDAELGRWVNRDPIGERGGVNLYGFVRNASPTEWDYLGLTRIGEILDAFFYVGLEGEGPDLRIASAGVGLWVMKEDDQYTQIVRAWAPVRAEVENLKRAVAADPDRWGRDHRTTSTWAPTRRYAPDPNNGFDILVAHPEGTDPDTARNHFIPYVLFGLETDGLHTSAIGSFRIIGTVNFTRKDCGATINVWMYNEMSRRSFGRFADHPMFSFRPMPSQFMWWNWKEQIGIRGSQFFDLPQTGLGEFIVGEE